jgi:addiction module RelE/StbE family toxin
VRAVWTPEALSDRREVWDYIASENPQAATAMDALFSDAVARLIDYPSLGRPGQVSGTRELIAHDHYRLVYEIELDTVWILALVHTSKQWPPIWNR